MNIQHVVTIPTLAALKSFKGAVDSTALLLGELAIGDGTGGTYYWDATSTEAEDLDLLSIVAVTGISTGRWKKVFNRLRILPHGYLLTNAGVKSFWTRVNYVTDANSQCTINLTEDNTTTGAAIFSEIWLNHSAVVSAPTNSTSNDVIISNVKSTATNLKTTTHVYARGASTTLGSQLSQILGLVIPGLRNVPQSTAVRFKVEGI